VAQNDKTSTKIKHASLYLFIRNKDRHLVFFTLWKYRRILCQLLKLRFGYTFYLHFCVLLKILINYFTNSINKLKLLIPPPLFGAAAQRGPMASSCSRSLGHTQWRTAFGRAPLDEWSARIRDLYLTTRNLTTDIHLCHPGGIRTRNPSNERPQTHALDRVADGIGCSS